MSIQKTTFIEQFNKAIESQSFIKISLGNKRDKTASLKNVSAKLVGLKTGLHLSFLYRYPTNDITKNFELKEGIKQVQQLLETEFLNADLFTSQNDVFLSGNTSGHHKLVTRPPSLEGKATVQQHDHQKKRLVTAVGNAYLQALGITTAEGLVKKDMQDKYRQINRYIEIIEGIIKQLAIKDDLHVVDMGSGKGYLTFALYDYLSGTLGLNPTVKGIELREALVSQCNQIANAAQFTGLSFETGTIKDASIKGIDVLIALHACDTATDDAIFSGIKNAARVIICAPCCHKEIRKQMAPDNALKAITKHGILLERQAETVTDSIRALLLEMHGYKTKVFEFIETEHTPKNILIVGIQSTSTAASRQENFDKLKGLKALFNIRSQHLETLLESL